MNIVVSAGVTKQEYSQRLADALVKVGELEQSAKQMIPKFPKSNQAIVGQTYAHLLQSLEAYKVAKDFFGDTHKQDLDPFQSDNMLHEERYERCFTISRRSASRYPVQRLNCPLTSSLPSLSRHLQHRPRRISAETQSEISTTP